MVFRRLSRVREGGFSLAELIVVIAILGIIAAVAIPSFLSYLQAAQTRGASQEVTTLLNQARQLAITRNRPVQFNYAAAPPTNAVRFLFTTAVAGDVLCADGARCWSGPGTDANGFIPLSNNAALSAVPGTPIAFTPLGGANGGTITVRNQANTSCMDVVVNPTGRVAATAHAGACP